MRRLLLGLLVGALIFGVSFAGAKVATVTNPMSTDLDGGGHNVGNVTNYFTEGGAVLGGNSLAAHAVALSISQVVGPPFVLLFAGSDDPSVAPPEGNNPPGSEYFRRLDPDHGQLWFKTGSAATAWICVAGCP